MQIRSASNGGVAEVSDEFAAELIKSGQWVPADAPVKAVRRARRTKAEIAEQE